MEKKVKKPSWNKKPDPEWAGTPTKENWGKSRASWMGSRPKKMLKYAYSDVVRAINRLGVTKNMVKKKMRYIDRTDLLQLIEFILNYRERSDSRNPFPKIKNVAVPAGVSKNFKNSFIRPPKAIKQQKSIFDEDFLSGNK